MLYAAWLEGQRGVRTARGGMRAHAGSLLHHPGTDLMQPRVEDRELGPGRAAYCVIPRDAGRVRIGACCTMMDGEQIAMDKRSDEMAQEKLSNGTISARRLLLATSLVGFLIATMPLSGDTVSAFGISLQTREGELKGIMIVVLIYLMAGFIVRTFTDLISAPASPAEKRLSEMIASQTEDIEKLTMNSIVNLLPTFNERKFHSQSFQSLLDNATVNTPRYRENMITSVPRKLCGRLLSH